MSSVNIYAEHNDTMAVRVVGHEYRIKVGDAWLHLSPEQAKQLHAKLADAGHWRAHPLSDAPAEREEGGTVIGPG
jgi:hypothetical protein